MSARGGSRQGVLALAALCLVSSVMLLAALVPAEDSARAAPAAARTRSAASRPVQHVAYARIAVVRVLTYYTGTLNSDPVPIPVLRPCAADGAIVGTTGSGLNSFNYVLTPTAAINPITPCEGVQAAFQALNGRAASWSITRIDVLLNVAYTGTGAQQIGAVRYTVDPTQITTIGGSAGPALLALPLTAGTGAPVHDLPVLSVPEASDAPANAIDTTVLDLTGVDGQPLGRDSLASADVTRTLYPISLPASQFNVAPQPTPTNTPTATPPEQTVVGGTVAPATPTRTLPTVTSATPTPLSASISLGAPVVDSNGRLTGMVTAEASGTHVITPLPAVKAAINQIKGKSGPLMALWQQGLTAFYSSPPQFSQAESVFGELASTDPDFGGVAPFLNASRQHTTTIPSLTQAASGGGSATGANEGLSRQTLLVVGGMAAAALVLLVVGVVLLRRRTYRLASRVPMVPPEEANLNLLPRDMPLDALPLDLDLPTQPMVPNVPPIDAQPTRPMPSIESNGTRSSARGHGSAADALGDLDGEPTLVLRGSPSHQLSRQRRGLALMPHAAGLSDPGIRRAKDPNQDNILALQGIRMAGERLQPYGLFIVADGMGGHLHGQEASRLSIEIVTTTVMQALSTNQSLDDAALLGLLREGVRLAGVQLRERNLKERADMGTTLTAALVVDDRAYVVNVGDSRTYLMSPEVGLRQVTTDHSVVASLVAAGVIRPEDVYTHPRRNQIYRSLGGEHDDTEADGFEVPLQAGDKLLLCSDGLWEMVRDPQIESILRGTADPQQAAELLVREANTNGGEDNISAIVVRLLEDMPQQAQPGMRVLVAPANANSSAPVADGGQ